MTPSPELLAELERAAEKAKLAQDRLCDPNDRALGWAEGLAGDLLRFERACTTQTILSLLQALASVTAERDRLQADLEDTKEGLRLSQFGDEKPFLAWRNGRIMHAMEAELEKVRAMSREDARAYVAARSALNPNTGEVEK